MRNMLSGARAEEKAAAEAAKRKKTERRGRSMIRGGCRSLRGKCARAHRRRLAQPSGQAAGRPRRRRQPTGGRISTAFGRRSTRANWDIEAHEARPGRRSSAPCSRRPPGLGVVVDGPIPYQALGGGKETGELREAVDRRSGSEVLSAGRPRATYMPFPFQIVQGTDRIMMVYEYAAAARSIHWAKFPKRRLIPGWVIPSGAGRARRSSSTSRRFNGMAWFDRAGNFQSETIRWSSATPL